MNHNLVYRGAIRCGQRFDGVAGAVWELQGNQIAMYTQSSKLGKYLKLVSVAYLRSHELKADNPAGTILLPALPENYKQSDTTLTDIE